MADVNWVKSRRSGKQGNCVLAARDDNGDVLLGDSKHPGVICARYTAEEWTAFLGGVRDGDFDSL
jgi:hypothetical protein